MIKSYKWQILRLFPAYGESIFIKKHAVTKAFSAKGSRGKFAIGVLKCSLHNFSYERIFYDKGRKSFNDIRKGF